MLKRKILLVVFTTFFCLPGLAQNASIQGVITQMDSITVLSAASVYFEDTNIGAITNGNGYYSIKGVSPGNYTLVVSSVGYFTLKKELTLRANEVHNVDFSMVEAISTLAEVTIITGGNYGVKDISGSVYYISPKEMQRFNYTDINRTLRAVPGVNLQEEDGFGLRPNIGLRGTGVERSSKITVMEDGILMAPAPYAAPAAYYFPTIGRMQGVEILKGSSQIKYGPYTTGGAINLISTQIPNDFSARINLLAGSFGGKNLHAFVGNKHKNFAYLVETFQQSSKGFKQLDAEGDTGFDKKDYLAKLRINTDKDAKIYQSLTFKIGQTTERSNETYLGLTEEDFQANPIRRYASSQKDQMNTEHSQFSLTHLVKFSKSFNMTTSVYRSNFTRNWYRLDAIKDSRGLKTKIGALVEKPADYEEAYNILRGSSSTLSDALFVKANNRSYYAQGVQTVLGFKFNSVQISHDIEVGIRYHKDQIDRFQWVDEYAMDNGVMELTKSGIHGTESNRIETAVALATYLQYKLKYGNFTATPGIRYENIRLERRDYGKNDPERTAQNLSKRSNQIGIFIPGIGLDYQFSEYLSMFAGVHKGFAPPGSKEGTLPEQSVNYELGVRHTKNALTGQAILFFNDYSNLLGTDLAAAGGGGTTELFNGGEVQTKGLEFQLTYDLLSSQKQAAFSLPLTVVYTYTDARFQNDFESTLGAWGRVSEGDQFPYLANHQFSFILALEHYKFSVNLSGKYMDKMRTVPGQEAIVRNEKIDSYFILDASANYVLHKNISLFANATNLFDKVYVVAKRPVGLRPGMPRAFNVGFKANF